MGSVAGALSTALLAGCFLVGACSPKKEQQSAVVTSESLPTTSLQVRQSELTRLEVTQPGKETVVLRVSNGVWSIEAPLAYPANVPSVEQMVAVLAEIEIQRRVADQPSPKHRVTDDAGVLVKAWRNGSALQPFRVGASAGEETYIRRADEDLVYAVQGRCRRIFDLSLEQLRDPAITHIDVKDIEAVTYLSDEGALSIVADAARPGSFLEATPSIRNFNIERASKNVEVLSELFAKGYVDSPVDKSVTGLFDPDTRRAQVSLRGQDEPLIVYLGSRTKNGRLHLRVSGVEQIYLVSAHLASSLVPERKHLERSDGEMQERTDQLQAKSATAEQEASNHADHKHGTELPTEVPVDLMGELRILANEQRD